MTSSLAHMTPTVPSTDPSAQAQAAKPVEVEVKAEVAKEVEAGAEELSTDSLAEIKKS